MVEVLTECLQCGRQFNDHNYMVHLNSVHQTDSPDQVMNIARAVQQNTPQGGPVVIGEGIPPTPEMLETMKQAEIELAQRATQPPDEEAVGVKGMSDADIQKLRELGVPTEVPKTPVEPQKPEESAPVEKMELQAIELTYRYIGNHKCGSEVETLMIKLRGELFAIAFCPQEKKQVKSIKVEKIDNDEPKPPEVDIKPDNVIKEKKKK